MENRKPVRFIRKRGRVIPIFSKKDKKLIKEGSGSILGGLGTMVAGGFAVGKLKKYAQRQKDLLDIKNQMAFSSVSRKMNIKSRLTNSGQMDLFGSKEFGSSKRFANLSAIRRASKVSAGTSKHFYKGMFSAKSGIKILKAARVSSAAAIGLGVEKLIQSSGLEGHGYVPELSSETIGVGSALLSEKGSRALVRKYGDGQSFRSQFNSVDKGKYLNKLKNLGKMAIRKRFKL